LRIDGEETIEVDIAHAQPFLLLSLYPSDSSERERYARDVTWEYFYQQIFEHCANRRPWGGSVKRWEPGATHRDRFKRHFMEKVLYSRSDTVEKTPQVFNAFGSLYPELAGILALRRVGDGASELAREMQRAEASLVLGRAIPRILRELPGCKPISIHDGILCQNRFAEDVRRIVADVAGEIYKVRPLVRVKG